MICEQVRPAMSYRSIYATASKLRLNACFVRTPLMVLNLAVLEYKYKMKVVKVQGGDSSRDQIFQTRYRIQYLETNVYV